ncbi:MAG: 3-oxoacyl-ACP synthase [Deltaproteobacteria bacterium CG_4_8_14_3_um_filter_51_11]|nr:BrnA antitoxin family protein [bacterium]OIP41902.1 MAG: 3-oxoacyl-ACP synthase [Desulfobacteraceae bacterium CG2_30_51_40]PIW00123.1 MAG: 3-oxoacyl-ACP synthase [Deltaproteobacteria bacterium CG17_big_fil_post_rev_8_21_14_2_50_51_6]PIX20210.1 MAG: 3-oxoacyl-ACP synthase [Deltaproteobacteria bacterium CG_4_8_14_3_um_filter_51_11]PJB39165.1 MAG: 3-oxoacyl-ACP synthase [Deltaproteobacteria bacterium CG_4_9_14_3_um_filter_51_14]
MKKQSKTDWAKIEALKEKDIDFSDSPELDDDFFAGATLWPGKKKQITLRLDPDVVDFFKKMGRGYQSSINVALRRYIEAQQRYQKSS